jgi:hypothetical protein
MLIPSEWSGRFPQVRAVSEGSTLVMRAINTNQVGFDDFDGDFIGKP